MNSTAFLGSKKIGLEILKTMHRIAPQALSVIMALDDRQDGRSCLDKFCDFAASVDKPLRVISKNADLEKVIEEFRPDFCMVNGYYRILKPDLLARFPAGCMGIHGSLLPKYRGGSPLVWSILNGDKQSGISLFYFDDGMDTGDLIGQRSYTIERDDSIADILSKVERLSVELIEENYVNLLNNTAQKIKQDHSQATYAAIRLPQDGKINWNWTAKRIHDFIRAQTAPYPGAFCSLEDSSKLTVWKSEVFDFPFHGTPGQVVQVNAESVIVSASEGTAVVLLDVQKEGNEPQKASKILRFNSRLL